MSAIQSLWMILAALLFAFMGVCVKYAAQHMGTVEIVFYRSIIGCVLLAAMARFRVKTLRTSNFAVHCRRGVFGFVSLLLFFHAVPLMTLSSALALLQTSPLFLALLTFVLARERPAAALVAALLVSFTGMLFVLKPLHAEQTLLDGIAALAAGVTAGCAYYNIRRLGVLGEGGIRTVFYFTLISTVLSGLPLAIIGAATPWSAEKLFWAVMIALTATAGQLALTRGLHYGSTMLSSSLMYTSILFSGVFDFVLWQHRPDVAAWLGIALIIAGNVAAFRLTRGARGGDTQG